jgi:hypothetical protein
MNLSKWGIFIVGTSLLGSIHITKIKTAHNVGGKYFKKFRVSVLKV